MHLLEKLRHHPARDGRDGNGASYRELVVWQRAMEMTVAVNAPDSYVAKPLA